MNPLKVAGNDRTKWVASTEEVCVEAGNLLTRFTKQVSRTSVESLKVVRAWGSDKEEKHVK